MIDYSPLFRAMQGGPLAEWGHALPAQLNALFKQRRHGNFDRWSGVIAQLAHLPASEIRLDTDRIGISATEPLSPEQQLKLTQQLKQLHPWRKGPYNIFGIHIDTEWRSDWKWQRLAPHIAPLKNRTVLDIGCGNGYHCWRMAGAGAKLVIGIDPTHLFLAQFLAIQHFLGTDWPVHLLPLGIEHIPPDLRVFDSVFSMGVLYHRRSPMDHLYELKGCLRPGGELVLETLVIEGNAGEVLVPPGRYAKMRNVWFIPTTSTLCGWMERCGFSNVRVVNVTTTTIEEQRSTDWMEFESLTNFLDAEDPTRTLEGHPAPRRATLLANA